MEDLLQRVAHKDHIIWDWNGTLLNDVHYAIQVVNKLLLEHSLPTVDREQYRKVFGFPIIDYYRKLGFDFSKVSFEDLCHRFVDEYMSQVHTCCEIFSHVLPILEHLKANNKKQSILSASDQSSLNHMVRHFNIDHFFDHIVGIDDKFGSSKVKKGQDLMALSAIPSGRTILIGDTDHDLEVAGTLGIDVIVLPYGHQDLGCQAMNLFTVRQNAGMP